MRTINAIIQQVTEAYLAQLSSKELPKPLDLERELLVQVNAAIDEENTKRARGHSEAKLRHLQFTQVATILIRFHHIRRLAVESSDDSVVRSDTDPIVVYDACHGVYRSNTDEIDRIIRQYHPGANTRYCQEVRSVLRTTAPYTQLAGPRYVAVGNGDYCHETQELLPFSPERVFLTRTPVRFNPTAVDPQIYNADDGTTWSLTQGILDLANGNESINRLLWEVLCCVLHPHVRTNKIIALIGNGNNGKGMLIELATHLVGVSNTTTASIADLGKDTTLPSLPGKQLVVSHENAHNEYIRNAETIKQLATRDPIFVNPKYQQPYNAVFEGNQLHSFNDFPNFGDRSQSMYRRWIYVPLLAKFEGIERKYIKDDYIRRDDVLEYALARILKSGFTGFTESDITEDLLYQAKLSHDPIRQFWDEFSDEFVWDILPTEFLYDIYRSWSKTVRPEGRIESLINFRKHIRDVVEDVSPEWRWSERARVGARMAKPEYLLDKYGERDKNGRPKWAPSVDPSGGFARQAREQRYRHVFLRSTSSYATSSNVEESDV
jgi:putative DNA primase/helicase